MVEQKHFIQKVSFEIDFDSEEKSYDFQREFSAFVNERLLIVAEKIFDEFGRKKHIQINKLEIDLGEVLFDNYKEETIDRLDNLLRDKLSLLLSGFEFTNSQEKPIIFTSQDSDVEVLRFFFTNGILPWSKGNNDSKFTIREIIQRLIDKNPSKLKSVIDTVILSESSRLRLVRQLEPQQFWFVLNCYLGSHADLAKKWFDEFLKLYKSKPILKSTEVEYRELLQMYLISEFIIKVEKLDWVVLTQNYVKFSSFKTSYSVTEEVLSLLESVLKSGVVTLESYNDILLQQTNSNNSESLFYSIVKSAESYGLEALVKEKISEQDKIQNLEKRPETKLLKLDDLNSKLKEVVSNSDIKDGDANSVLEKGKTNSELEKLENFNPTNKQKGKTDSSDYLSSKLLTFFKDFFSKAILRVDYNEGLDLVKFEKLLGKLMKNHSEQLKLILIEAQFDLNKRRDLFLVESFSEKIRKEFLSKVLRLTNDDYKNLIIDSVKELILKFLTEGIVMNTSDKIWFNDSKSIEQTFLEIYSPSTDVNELKGIENTVLSSNNSRFLISQFERFFSRPVLQRYFPEILNQIEISKDTNSASKKVDQPDEILKDQQESIKIEKWKIDSVNSTNQLIAYLEYYFKNGKLPEHVDGSISEIVNRFFELDVNQQHISFFYHLTGKELEEVLKETKAEIKHVVYTFIENFKVELSKLNEAIDSLQKEVEEFEKGNVNAKSKKEEKEVLAFKKKIDSGEPLYISNAGIIIIHPYLSMFFKKLELLEKRQFKDEYTSHKAVHLLQYIANKTTKMEEHELVINKIMCGIELHEPLMRDIELSQEEIDLCESLLEGVIQNWAILKKTSPDNLRASFLMRDGRLRLEPDGWKLKVEEKGYDVLVEKLPWSISMVKLPWMKKMIHVEWK